MWWLTLTSLLATAATPEELQGLVVEFNQHAQLRIPQLSARQAEQLLDGDVVRVLFPAEDPEAPSAAVAFMISPVARPALWIAAQDPHTQVDPGLTEKELQHLGTDHAIWYGYWDLPRPVRDRQWVVESRNTHRVSAATEGRAWEHTWNLVEDGLSTARPFIEAGKVGAITLEQVDTAIYTPVNQGSWFMFSLDDGQTMLGYQATSVVGGAIPTWVVTKLVMSRLESILRDLEVRAQTWSPTHYGASHAAVPGGDGQPIPRF